MKKNLNKENLLSRASGGDYVDFIVNNDKKKWIGRNKGYFWNWSVDGCYDREKRNYSSNNQLNKYKQYKL